jgi:hypothetical protein
VRVKRSDFDVLSEASYAGKPQASAGVWDGDVPTPMAPDERAASPPDAPSDGAEAEADDVAEKPTG